MQTITKNEKPAASEGVLAALRGLLDDCTKYYAQGFSIDIGKEPDKWDGIIRSIGVKNACRHMAEHVCREYEKRIGRPFLFGDACVSDEIKYHLDAFMVVRGYAGYHRNLAALLLPKRLIISRCKEIDISTNDARDLKQRYIFRYKRGIRDCYKNTPDDPFRRRKADKRGKPHVL